MEMEDKKQKKTRERKPRAPRDNTSVGADGKYSRYDSQVCARSPVWRMREGDGRRPAAFKSCLTRALRFLKPRRARRVLKEDAARCYVVGPRTPSPTTGRTPSGGSHPARQRAQPFGAPSTKGTPNKTPHPHSTRRVLRRHTDTAPPTDGTHPQVAAMQRDSGTYCDEPADAAAFAEWLAGFTLDEHADDVAAVLLDNAFMQELQSRIVPLIVDRDTFWTRYFFR